MCINGEFRIVNSERSAGARESVHAALPAQGERFCFREASLVRVIVRGSQAAALRPAVWFSVEKGFVVVGRPR